MMNCYSQDAILPTIFSLKKIEISGFINAFDTLKKERYTQDADRTQLKMKQTRTAVDLCYHETVERINALIIVNGAIAYGGFVNKLNVRIEAYNQMLALRKGKKDAKDNKKVDKKFNNTKVQQLI